VPRTGDHKTPIEWWAKRAGEANDFGPNDNIGARLGVEIEKGWYLADVDIDCTAPGADLVADEILPQTGMAFGRKSKPRSHRLCLVDHPIASLKYKGTGTKPLVELRCVSKGKKETFQTVVPPGVHASGELIEWDPSPRGFARVAADGLVEMVKLTAIGLAILEVWPAIKLARARVISVSIVRLAGRSIVALLMMRFLLSECERG
jgi:hypothetical protein